MLSKLLVESDSVKYYENSIQSLYIHTFSKLYQDQGIYKSKTISKKYTFKTDTKIGKIGLMMVGFGGNNGSTILGGIIANQRKITWNTKKGQHRANMYGSMTQQSTMKIGQTQQKQIFMKIKDVIPMIDPSQLIVGGWDINSTNLGQAMKRAQVFDYDLQQKLYPYMKQYVPKPSIYDQDFIASNQKDRANNILKGTKKQKFEIIRKNIRQFKIQNELDKIIILWTSNTERFVKTSVGVHDTEQNILKALEQNNLEISPSTIFALAAMKQDCIFINGSPQNTIVDGVKNIKGSKGILIGNDFKTGQTKFKTSFMEFLVGAGIKPKSIVSYNHLGNNDGKNLSSEKQFKSKQTSKSACVSDILDNSLLFSDNPEKGPDHTVVIKYVPAAGDSKKAIDEYVSQIFMGGQHTFMSYNVCEDSLLAAGIIIDLIVLSQLMSRIQYKTQQQWLRFSGVVSFLGYLMKAPQSKGPTINSLTRQRMCIQNLIRVLKGMPLQDHLLLNYRT